MSTRKKILIFVIGTLASLVFSYTAFAYPSIYPTGTTIYKPYECYNSYVLLYLDNYQGNHPSNAISQKSKSLPIVELIDMNGNVVHTWHVAATYNRRCRLWPTNGHLLYSNTGAKEIWEYDWNSNVVWTYKMQSYNDLRWLPNNNRLINNHEPIPDEYQKKVKDHETLWWGVRKRSANRQRGAGIYEVTPDKKIVWEWHAHEHLDLNRYSPVTPKGDWIHMNTISPLPENKWYDQGDKRFKPGNILICPRNIDMIYIIDKESKKIVWEWTHDYKGGLSHAHEPEMIEKGIPGEGNIILFDNALFPKSRRHNGQSFIIELNPITKEIVWKYETLGYANLKFFSKTQGTQKRLPNGNTFINESNTGRLFQIKPDGEIVWEYVAKGGTSRSTVIPYDYSPMFKAFPKPPEEAVTPPNNLEWHLKPDKYRRYD